MNIIYLHSHDTGRYVEPYGCPVNTPNIHALAEQGVLFRDAHATAPTCSPSRAGLLTGESPHQAGMVGLAHCGGKLVHPERHLAAFLAGHGYQTVLCGLSHVGFNCELGHFGVPCRPCYTRESPIEHWRSDAIRDYAVNFLQSHKKVDQPFFLDVGYMETHRLVGFSFKHNHPKDGDGNPNYVCPPPVISDCPKNRRDWLDFRHAVERLDRYHGDVLDALEKAGLADDTLVLCTTDHGLAFPGMKCNLTQHGTGVMMILRAPGRIPAGTVSDALVSHLDFYPTLCDVLGLKHPEWLQGHSLLPLLDGKTEKVRDLHFSEITFHAAFEPVRAVRSKRWNYVRHFAAPHHWLGANIDGGHSKTVAVANGLLDAQVPTEELFDLVLDPMERHNLAADPAHAQIREELRQALAKWMRDTNDPLLSGDPTVMALPHIVNGWEETGVDSKPAVWDIAQWKIIQPL